MIASAPWGRRSHHTSVIDAAGAIYVIGGGNDATIYNDVWVSADGGAGRTRAGAGGRGTGALKGCQGGTTGALNGTPGALNGHCISLKGH